MVTVEQRETDDDGQLLYLRRIHAVLTKGKLWMKKKPSYVIFVCGGNIYSVRETHCTVL